MTYLEEVKVEAKSILKKKKKKEYSHEADFCYGRASGGTWINVKRKVGQTARSETDGNPVKGRVRPWAVGKTWHCCDM